MTYTVQLEFDIEEDEIRTEEQVKDIVKEIFDYCNCTTSNIKVININN